MNNASLMIAVTEAKSAAESETTLEGRLISAMKVTKDHWLLTDEDSRFRAAVGAVLLLSDDADKERITSELAQLKTLGAMMSGVPVNLDSIEELKNPIGLIKHWNKVKETP